MPIYEFQCTKCSHIDELLMSFSDPAPTSCSTCGAPTNKIISNSSFALKGSGWYVTDYGNKKSAASASSAPSTAPASPATSAPSTSAATPSPSAT